MAYLPDLSEYNYRTEFERPGTKAVAWLDQSHDFPKTPPSEEISSRLWEFCRTSVAQTRGVHPCPLCGNDIPHGGGAGWRMFAPGNCGNPGVFPKRTNLCV